jgi:regulation of enolase protein 1 (concanavalin A-like superfamily)
MKAKSTSVSGGFRKLFWVTGLLLVSAAAWNLQAEKFVIVVLPDTQGETAQTPPSHYISQMNWIVNNKTALNIKYVLHVGDLVNWDTPFSNPPHYMYVHGSNGFNQLFTAGIPYAIAVGNHDTAAVGGKNPDGSCCYCGGSAGCGDVHANVRDTSTYNAFFPVNRFTTVRDRYELNKMDNAYHTFSVAGLNFLVINGELDPRQGALDWMKSVVATHPHHNIIYITHNYLTDSGVRAGAVGYADLSPQVIWDQLLRTYGNMRFVFCGHLCTAGSRVEAGLNGNTVYQMLSDYQCEGTGNGWLRIVEIDTVAATMSVKTYSPVLNSYKTDVKNQFTFSGINFVSAGITVPNFSFETPTTANYVYNPPGGSWSFAGPSGLSSNKTAFTIGNPNAPVGTQVAFVQGTSTVAQALSGFVPGTTYKVTFAAAQRGNFNQGGQTWNVLIDGSSKGSYAPSASASNYVDYTATFTATATSHTLAFKGSNLNGGDNTVFIDNVRIAPSLPSPWNTADIGSVSAAGLASFTSGGVFDIVGSGADIWGTADEFRYVYQSSSGDCSVSAKVNQVSNTDQWAKAGVMIREGTGAGAIHASVVVTPGAGISFQRRTSTGGTSVSTTQAGLTAPYWVRITRTGNSFAAYYSSNGSTWTQLGTAQTITMASGAIMGMAVTSHNDGNLCTANFSNVTATP